MKDKLLPCPFCGTQPTMRRFEHDDGALWHVYCDNKDGKRHHAFVVEKNRFHAMDAWNERG